MFKRRFLATILLIALITSTFPCTYAIQSGFDNFTPQNTYSADTFRDISDSDWFARSVAAVYELGLMRGKGERRFDPNADVTIAEAITVAATLHSIYTTGSPGNFTAAAGEAWYVPYANYAHEHGIIDYHGGTMIIESHDNGVWMTDITHRGTRAIFAGILGKALPEEALSPINDIPNEAVPDFSLSSQYGPQVYALYRAGILTGSNEYGTFDPGSSIKRREVAAILSRMADPSLRVSFTPKSPDYVVTGTCGSNYTWEIIEGAFIASGGDNVTYSLDLGTGKMVISGNAQMGIFQEWAAYASKIKTVVIEEGVQSVGLESFLDCTNLESIQIPSTVTRIHSDAFRNCSSLRSVTLPEGLTMLGDYAFAGCTSLESIILPSSVTELSGGGCFLNCTSLKTAVLSPALNNLPFYTFSGCTALERVENTRQITIYGVKAFRNCTSLSSIDLNASAKLGSDVFENCPAG